MIIRRRGFVVGGTVAATGLVVVVLLPATRAAAWRSLGFVELTRAVMGTPQQAAVALPRAVEALEAAHRIAPTDRRATVGLALAAANGGRFEAAADLWARVGPELSDSEVGHALDAFAQADRPRALLHLYRNVRQPAIRKRFMPAAAAAAIAIAREPSSGLRDTQLAESLAIWPDNLCAKAERAARRQNTNDLADLVNGRFDGAFSDAVTYQACLIDVLPSAVARVPALAPVIAQDVMLPALWAGAQSLVDGLRSVVPVGQARPAPCIPVPGDLAADVSMPVANFVVTGVRPGPCPEFHGRSIRLRLTDSSAPSNSAGPGGGGVIDLIAPNELRNGTFELGTGVGPYVPTGFRVLGGTPPGLRVVERFTDGGRKAVSFPASDRAGELRQSFGPVAEGDVLLVLGEVRADVPTDPNRGVAIYAYWRTRRGQAAGYSAILSGLSAHPNFRTFAAYAVVPVGGASADIAFSTTADVPVALDNLWVLNLTGALRASKPRESRAR